MADPGKTVSPAAEAVERTMLKPVVPEVPAAELAGLPRIGVDEGDGGGEGAELQLQGVIGTGGMGRIELGRQRVFGREVAVKRVRPDRYCAEAVAALLRESRFTGSLEHPNIVPVHQLGLDGAGRPMLVMKRVDGASWRSVVKSLSLERNLEILQQVCNAVEFAHRRGVLHRDLKLDNVMVGELGQVYVVDWGIAVPLPAPLPHDFAGTPAYLAPEMLEPSAPLDARTDVYLLGAVLHEVLTGTLRYDGADVQQVLAKARVSQSAAYGPEVPEELGALCNRACARAPEERPATALQFSEAITAYLRHKGSIELAKRLEQRRLELENETEPARVRTLIAETTFGFRQALEVWPENPVARRGLQLAGEKAVAFELEQRNAAGAEAALAALPEPRPQLVERVRSLRAEVDAQARAQRELEALRRQADTRVGARARSMIGATTSFVFGVAAFVLWAAGVRLTWPLLLGLTYSFSAMTLVAFLLRWRHMSVNDSARQHGYATFWLMGGLAAGSVLGWLGGAQLNTAIAMMFVTSSVGLGVAAMMGARALLLSSATCAIGAAISVSMSEPMLSNGITLMLFSASQVLRSRLVPE